MEERDWIILQKIGEKKNISQVAEELFISQPSLTYRINKIEKLFGVQLFIRGIKGIRPNSQGELVINYAGKMLQELKGIKEEVNSTLSLVKGNLYIGATNAVAQYILPNLLAKFVSQYPQVEPHVFTGFNPFLINSLMQEKIHIAFLRENMDWSNYKKKLSTENLYLVSKEPLELGDLPNLPRINYKTNQSLKILLDSWWTDHFVKPPNITMEVDNADVCTEFIRAGLGYGLLPALNLLHEEKLWKVPLKFTDGFNVQRETWVYASNESKHYSTATAFLEFLEVEHHELINTHK